MKSTIGRRILILVFIPFLIVFAALSTYISYTMTRYFTDWTELELKGISEINSAQLEGKIDSVRITVLSVADILEKVDELSDDARVQVAETVLSMFVNESIYNAWLTYEPNAFDGKDAEHTNDYPGAPSGRFMLSYINEDDEIIIAPDMDETTIDDLTQSPWYVIPRNENRLYIDVANSTIKNLYDYGVGSEPAYTLSVVAPLTRDGQVIGCVGADIMFDTMTFGIDNAKNATVGIFYPDGRVFYAENIEFAEESLDSLKFVHKDQIKRAFAVNESLFLPDEYSPFIDDSAITYFHPVRGSDVGDAQLFLYVALPRAEALAGLQPIIVLMAVVALAVLMVLLVVFAFAAANISKPIRLLTLAADAISQGDLNAEIASFSDTKGEIGLLSRSLHRMVEQFRVYIISLKQSQEENSFNAQIREHAKVSDTVRAADMMLAITCERFGFYRASAVEVAVGSARIFSRIGGTNDMNSDDFLFHTQTAAMLVGKTLMSMNRQTLLLCGVKFFDEQTLSACIVPIWDNNMLTGYLIFENDKDENPIDAGAETLLACVASAFADLIQKRSDSLAAAASPVVMQIRPSYATATSEDKTATSAVLSSLRAVDGLEVDGALDAMGGLTKVYEQSIRLLARLLPETLSKLDSYLADDMNAFAIGIHGLKGSLNNVGAYGLGDEAAKLEKAAKSGGTEYCTASYPRFKAAIEKLRSDLYTAFGQSAAKCRGELHVLVDALRKAGEAAASFDVMDALDAVRPLIELSFDEHTDAAIVAIVQTLEVFECDKALERINELKAKHS